jgi:hypothetical protein
MKKAIYFLCGILLLAQVMGCGAQFEPDASDIGGKGEVVDILGKDDHRDPEQFISLYFLDPSGAYLFPLSFSVPGGASAEELIKYLSTGPMRKEWGQSPVPKGITIQNIDLVGGRALVT